jgi:hypothetical protein
VVSASVSSALSSFKGSFELRIELRDCEPTGKFINDIKIIIEIKRINFKLAALEVCVSLNIGCPGNID